MCLQMLDGGLGPVGYLRLVADQQMKREMIPCPHHLSAADCVCTEDTNSRNQVLLSLSCAGQALDRLLDHSCCARIYGNVDTGSFHAVNVGTPYRNCERNIFIPLQNLNLVNECKRQEGNSQWTGDTLIALLIARVANSKAGVPTR